MCDCNQDKGKGRKIENPTDQKGQFGLLGRQLLPVKARKVEIHP
jgi:hypothetical protein